MRAFQFELEEILRVRRFEQQQAEIELGKAVAAENEIQSKLDALAMRQAAVKNQTAGSTQFSDIAAASQFYSFVRAQSESLLNELAGAKLVSDEKREILRQAMQKVDSLEKLKEQQRALYMGELLHEEENELDDIVTSRFKPGNE